MKLLTLLLAGSSGKWLEATGDVFTDTVAWFSTVTTDYPNVFRIVFAIAALAAGAYLLTVAFRIVRGIFRKVFNTIRSFRQMVRRFGHRMEKTRIFKSMKGKFMARWKIGELGSRIDDAIFDMEMRGRLSDQEGKRLRKQIGQAIGDFQLIPRRFNKMYLRHYFLGSKGKDGKDIAPVYQKLSGPAKTIPGGHPKDDPKPETNVVSSKFVERLRQEKKVA